jgi:hypothetical protein
MCQYISHTSVVFTVLTIIYRYTHSVFGRKVEKKNTPYPSAEIGSKHKNFDMVIVAYGDTLLYV